MIGREPKPMTANYEQAAADHVIDLVEEDGRPIALIEVIPRPSHLLIENVAVLPDRHGEGSATCSLSMPMQSPGHLDCAN